MKIIDLFFGTKILETKGKFQVVRDLAWGTYIKSGGLTQSGGIVFKIWKQTLKKVLDKKPVVENCLILGIGGGSAAKVAASYWVGCKITGIDVDKDIVSLGEKYLGLKGIDVVIADAFKFVREEKKQYDLILVDLYNGDKFPEEFESQEFINNLKKIMIYDGAIVFNRLYGGKKTTISMEFASMLAKNFKIVDHMFPQANVELICYN